MTISQIKVLSLKLNHLKSFITLWNQDYKLLTSSGLKMTLKKAEEGFKKKMFNYLGAFINDKLIGFILLNQKNKTLWIKHFLVDKKLRDKGIGKKLIRKALNIAKRNKLILKTEVLKENQVVLNFFLKNNFVIKKIDNQENQFILQLKKI